jgi:GT2 family glycosyltransferase
MGSPLVSVVIITWNRKDDVLESVGSVYNQNYQNVEIVVVDNGSTDGTADALAQGFPGVKIVALDRNTGVSEGRNLGVAAAKGDIIFFLDSDASLGNDTLNDIVHKFQHDPAIGVITCKILNPYTQELDPNTWIFTQKDKAHQDLEFFSYSFCEAGAAVRRKVFDQAGLFWEFLFFGREGDELSLRIWDAGFKILYWPEAIVYHRVSPYKRVTGGKRSYFDLRNCLYIYSVRYPWWLLIRFVPLKIGASLIRGVRKGYVRQVIRAVLAVIEELPYLLKQRQPISNETAHQYLALQREHGSLSWDMASWIRNKT